MFQLFRRGSSSLERTWPLSFRSLSQNPGLNLADKTCLLCKLLSNNNNSASIQFRNQSSWATKVNTKMQNRKKRKNNTSKSYTDILVVTKASSCTRKANVTRLTPSDLNVLTSTNVSLNELYKIKNGIKIVGCFSPQTYSNLAMEGVKFNFELVPLPSDSSPKINRNVDKPEDEPTFSKTENIDILCEESEFERDLEAQSLANVKSSLQPEEIVEDTLNSTEEIEKQPSKSAKVLKHRDTIALKTLATYIEVCNYLRHPQKGLGALYFHQNRSRRDSQLRISSMKSRQVYYQLLKGFADKGDYHKIEHVLEIMEAEKVKLNLNCYVAILECLGKVNVDNFYLKDIRIHIKQALNQGISFDNIMNKGFFLNNEREYVLQALKAYDPNYVPTYKKPRIWYDNCLVDHLNNESQMKFEVAESKGYGELITQSAMQNLVQKQVELEEKGYITIKSINHKGAPSKDVLYFRSALDDHYKMWAESAQTGFNRDLATLTAQRHAFNMEPYFRSIPAKDFIEIMVQEATKIAEGSETYSPEVQILYKMLGMKVYAKYMVLKKQKTGVMKKVLTIHSKYCQNYSATHTEIETVPARENLSNSRIQWQLLEHSHCHEGATLKMGNQHWVPTTLTAIGKFLYHIIMHDFKIDVNSLRPNSKHQNLLPAFYTIFRSQGRMVKEEIKPHPVLSKLYKSSLPETLTFPANEVPMFCPPVPWTAIDNGGYIIAPTEVVRLPFQASSQKKRMSEVKPAQLYPNFDALNQLATVPWKVNKKILDVLLEVFRNGGSAKLDVPEPPSSLHPPPNVTAEMDKDEKYQIFKQKLQHRRKKGEMYSLWCDCLYRLSLANHFRDDIFWLPHNMDFRGRVYPVPPHLNHLGSDFARSMLVFGEARPLGPQGLDWLKIHLINLTGLKKRNSVQDRLDYANDHLHLILDSADNPLTGQKWWAESDEPWQTLACCMEIADVIRSGIDPCEYMSHFPVHQDGSCNGLQHYAALGRDSAGAYSVNLAPCDTPQDVYSAVVNLVEERRAADEAEGVGIAKILNGVVKRKVIKQTIMTTVYGVTRFGARLQIAKQLKDIDDFPKDYVWAGSSYLTGRTFESLRTMFTSTREIQEWFTECAVLISGTGGYLVEWVTPMGLPVVQPYIKYKYPSMPSGYEGFLMDQFEKPNVMKQKNAFPPNFIHSLDSSHMMLTSLHCERAGITFVSVHDCYWTHPSTIHIMNKICREQFVALHSQPILENLSVYLNDLYSYDEKNLKVDGSVSELNKKRLNKILRQLPRKGSFDIKNVLDSVYFFS